MIAAGFLIWHVADPAARVDGWTITLLVVALLPWLGTVFESLGLPGGGNVKWREVKAEQMRQADDIQALRFLRKPASALGTTVTLAPDRR
jgi:hypothetical protein